MGVGLGAIDGRVPGCNVFDGWLLYHIRHAANVCKGCSADGETLTYRAAVNEIDPLDLLTRRLSMKLEFHTRLSLWVLILLGTYISPKLQGRAIKFNATRIPSPHPPAPRPPTTAPVFNQMGVAVLPTTRGVFGVFVNRTSTTPTVDTLMVMTFWCILR